MQSSVERQAGCHVAIIMDGNGRWATRRGLPRSAGHHAGVKTVRGGRRGPPRSRHPGAPSGRCLAPPACRTSPNVDLLIRSGGEKRLSDFLLWESAYAELCFVDTLWPDFGADDLRAALADFRSRERRFGGLGEVAPLAAAR